MPDWIEEFEHEGITEDNRGAFNTHMEKFPTQADAVMDGYGLAKMKGKPFRMPESMDKLPDDVTRTDFTSQAQKLLGIEYATDLDSLSEINLKKGLPEGSAVDESFMNAFKQFVVDNKKIPNSVLEPLAEFFNVASVKAQGDMVAKTAADFATSKQAVNDALIADKDFGTKEKLDEQTVLLHRALTNNVGLNAEEANGIAEFLRDREGATNPVLRKVLLKTLAPLAASSSNENGTGNPPVAPKDSYKGTQVEKDLGWSK